MNLKKALQKQYPAIRWIYIGVCILGGVAAIAIGYPFFHDRALLFGIFIAYMIIMVGAAMLMGLRILAILIL